MRMHIPGLLAIDSISDVVAQLASLHPLFNEMFGWTDMRDLMPNTVEVALGLDGGYTSLLFLGMPAAPQVAMFITNMEHMHGVYRKAPLVIDAETIEVEPYSDEVASIHFDF